MVIHSGLPSFDCSIAVLGAGGVGKSALLSSLFKKDFPEEHEPTLDTYYMHTIAVDGVHHNLRIIDTGATEGFPVMRRFSIDICEGFVIVYSLEDPKSFEEAIQLLDEVISIRVPKQTRKIPVVLVANKLDIGSEQREQCAIRSKGELDARAGQITATYVEVSAKLGFPAETGIFHSLVKILTTESRKRSKLQTNISSFRKSVSKTTKCFKGKKNKKRTIFRVLPRVFGKRKTTGVKQTNNKLLA